jgi:hypothetical protein
MFSSCLLHHAPMDDTFTMSRKGQAAEPLHLEVLRELTPEDFDAPTLPRVGPAPIKAIRQTHHLVARLLAEGRPNIEVSAITGITQARISSYKQDPAFAELLEYYKVQVQAQYANVHERLAAFGFSCLEEAQQRLDEAPEDFSLQELRQWMTATFDRSIAPSKNATAQGSAVAPPVVINVQFHTPEPEGLVIEQERSDV